MSDGRYQGQLRVLEERALVAETEARINAASAERWMDIAQGLAGALERLLGQGSFRGWNDGGDVSPAEQAVAALKRYRPHHQSDGTGEPQ